jgi:hypothetical protein
MGHYDENRKFDDERRAAGKSHAGSGTPFQYTLTSKIPMDPKESKIKKVKFEVQVPTEVYSYTTLRGWSDGPKWVCDTKGAFDMSQREPNIGVVNVDIEGVAEFIKTYPHPVGAFYVIADHKEVVKLIIDNPERDIRHLLIG